MEVELSSVPPAVALPDLGLRIPDSGHECGLSARWPALWPKLARRARRKRDMSCIVCRPTPPPGVPWLQRYAQRALEVLNSAAPSLVERAMGIPTVMRRGLVKPGRPIQRAESWPGPLEPEVLGLAELVGRKQAEGCFQSASLHWFQDYDRRVTSSAERLYLESLAAASVTTCRTRGLATRCVDSAVPVKTMLPWTSEFLLCRL